ncbi:MAG: SH3 domain-containing protein [Mesorhizobium sp.]
MRAHLIPLLMILTAPMAAFAEDAPPPAAAPELFEVTGLAIDDELNLRATASATGMLVARVRMGAVVRNLGCADVDKYRWCKIAATDDERIQGWAAARYLVPLDQSATPTIEEDAPLVNGGDDASILPN